MRSRQALALAVAVLAPAVVAAQPAGDVELAVRLDAIVSSDETPPGDLTVEFLEASSREPMASYVVEASAEEQSFVFAVPAPESRSGWLLWARSEGWWSPAAFIPWDEREASLTLVPEGMVRFAVDGTDTAVDFLETGKVWIDGRVYRRRSRLDRGLYGGPCEVDRQPDHREVLIACPFARDEEVELRVRLGPFLPLLRPEVTVEADTDLGLVEPVRGARVTASLASPDSASHQFRLRQRDGYLALGWVAWTDSGGAFTFEGLSPGEYELRWADSDGDNWLVRIESLNDRIDLGQLVSVAGNRLAVSFWAPSAVEIGSLRPLLYAATLGPNGDVDSRGRMFESQERATDDSFVWRGLPAGDYEVQVEDDRGNRWHREVVHSFGQDHFTIEFNAIPLVGRIERGGEPLPGVMVWFGGLWGMERVSFRSREEGRFSGLLPREGSWWVQMTAAPSCDPCEGDWNQDDWEGFDSGAVDDLGAFEIEADSDGIARVRIELGTGVVSGRVVRANRKLGTLEPVADARVRVSAVEEAAGSSLDDRRPANVIRRTDGFGFFEVRGLPEREYNVAAEGYVDERELRSQPFRIRVPKNVRVDDVEIRLEERRPVTVIVRSGGLPVAGAQTFVLHPPGTGKVTSGGYTRAAGSAGHFVPMEAEFVDVVVRAEGLGMNGWRFEVQDGAPMEIDLTADRGTLRVPTFEEIPGVKGSRHVWDARLVTPGGASIRIGTLAAINDRGQIQRDDDETIVNDLVPGAYLYCPKDAACTRVDISPWGESRVRD